MAFEKITDAVFELLRKPPIPKVLWDMLLRGNNIDVEMVSAYRDLDNKFSTLANKYLDLAKEASKLQAENEFMLKLINQKENKE